MESDPQREILQDEREALPVRPAGGLRAGRRWLLAATALAAAWLGIVGTVIYRSGRQGEVGSRAEQARPWEGTPPAPVQTEARAASTQPVLPVDPLAGCKESKEGVVERRRGEPGNRLWIPPTAMKSADHLQECRDVAAEVCRRYPNTPDALTVLARAQETEGKYAEARKTWGRCVELAPGCLDAHEGVMKLTWRQGDHARVAELARRTLTFGPSHMASNYLARALMELGKPEEAAQVLEASLKANDGPAPVAHYLLGRAYSQLRRWELAKSHFASAIEAHPDLFSAYYGMSTVLARLGQKEQSQRYLAEFQRLRRESDHIEARMLRLLNEVGERYAESDMGHDSGAYLGGLASIHVAAGWAYYNLRDARKAEEHWRRAAALHPGNSDSREALSMLLRGEGRLGEAIAMLKELTEIEPKNTQYYAALGTLYASTRQFDLAEGTFQKICQLMPQAPLGYASLAKLYVGAGRKTSEAPALARKAVEIAPVADHYRILAEAGWKNGDAAAARAAIQKAIDLDPKNPYYRSLLDAISQKK